MIMMTITMTATIMIIMIRKRTITTLKITITITITINITITITMMITMYEITSPLPNFNGCISEVWEWVNNFLPNFIMDYGCKYMYLSTPGLKLIHSSKGATSLFCSMQISDSKCEESDVRVLIIECLRWHSQNIKMTDNLRSRESVHTKSKQYMISRGPASIPHTMSYIKISLPICMTCAYSLGLESVIHNQSRAGPEKSQWANTSMLYRKWKGSASVPKQGDFFLKWHEHSL